MSGRIRVLIVENHLVLAEGLELALGRHPDLEPVGIAATVTAAVALAEQTRPAVIIMDYYLPDGTGADATLQIRQFLPTVAVVILTAQSSEETLLASVQAGACGYLSKSQAAAQVVSAVRQAAEGEMLIPAATLAGLVARSRQRLLAAGAAAVGVGDEPGRALSGAPLTPREREIFLLIAQGLDNRAIAAHLYIGVNTVRSHVQSILDKLGVHSKLQALVRAGELGLLDR